MNPHISMSPSAHYVTQSSAWERADSKPLTDKRIHEYALAGKYGPDAQHRAEWLDKCHRKKRTAPRASKQDALDALVASLLD